MIDILNQVKDEYWLGLEFVQNKRDQFRERIRKYNNQSKKKINITLIANHIDTLISSSWTDKLTVKFISRDGFFGTDKAENLTNIARFDQWEEDYSQLFYQKDQDKYFFWVWIVLQAWWQQTTSTPQAVTINPLSWIPDPKALQNGKFSASQHRFMWFNMTTNIYELRNAWTYSKEALNNIVKGYHSTESDSTMSAYNDSNNLNDTYDINTTPNFSLEIYHHYTIFNGKKYLITTDWDLKQIIRATELKSVLKEEKKDSSLIPRPVALFYYKPQRNNPFGGSICDLLETKQDAMNILANLNVVTAKKEALWGRFLVNSRLISNKEDLLKPSVDTQYFWIDPKQLQPWESINNAIAELPQTNIKTDTLSMFNFLESEANKATWVDQLQRGIVPDKTMTKAEAQQIQWNANLLSIRSEQVDARWLKEFWYLRWRSYNEFFSKGDKKSIILDTDFETDTEIFKKDEFEYSEMPYIKIGTINDLNAIDEKRKQFLSLYLPQVLQDPTKAQVTKDLMEREYLRLQGYSPNQINQFIPLSKVERYMIDDYIPMINFNVVPKMMIENVIEDIFTAYVYVQKAQPTDAKTIMLETLKSILKQPTPQEQQWWWAMSNSAANIQMSQWSQSTQGDDLITRDING